MKKPTLPSTANSNSSKRKLNSRIGTNERRRRNRKSNENSDVLISAVVSSYLLTYLHHILQKAEFSALQDGQMAQAANFAQLRKVLCMDARSMEDASAIGIRDNQLGKFNDSRIRSRVA